MWIWGQCLILICAGFNTPGAAPLCHRRNAACADAELVSLLWKCCSVQMMDSAECFDPYRRPARRTQWIVSTLAYHYGLDRGVENEIIVLATGLDQYLQEIFHHLDYRGAGKIPAEDFNVLCEVLGLSVDPELVGGSDRIPSDMTFRHFHAKLCGYFSTRAGCRYETGQLLVGEEGEHIETQIRLRSPLKRREKLLSEGVSGRCYSSSSRTRECYEEIVALEAAEDRIGKLEDENASLRELIEDMRAALQSSDARCLAVQVRGCSPDKHN